MSIKQTEEKLMEDWFIVKFSTQLLSVEELMKFNGIGEAKPLRKR